MDNQNLEIRELFENIIEKTYNNLVLADSNGNIIYASPSFCSEFNFSLEKDIAFDIFDMVYPEDVDMAKNSFLKAVSTGEKVALTFRVMLRNKNFNHVEAIFSNLLNYDSLNCMLISFRNVSAYKNSLEELESYKNHLEEIVEERTSELRSSLNKEKAVIDQQKQFISMVSHEFRTPLTIIDGNAQIIVNRGDKLTQEMLQRRAVTIRKAVDRLVGLIERVLSDKVMESGDLSLDVSLCDYASIVRDICIEKLGISPNSKIKLDIGRNVPKMMLDEKLIHQVALNLISNAFKYSKDNPDIKVKLYVEDDNAILEVSDRGVGIPAEEIPKIFTKYFRASSAAAIPGTGLGLNLVKQIANLHGGDAFIESEVGMGTTITVKIPVVIPDTIN